MRHLSSSSGLLYRPLPPLAPSSSSGSWVSPQHSVPLSLLRRPPLEGSFPTKRSLTRYTPSSAPLVSFSVALASTCRSVCSPVCRLSAPPPASVFLRTWAWSVYPAALYLGPEAVPGPSKCPIEICWMKDTASGD